MPNATEQFAQLPISNACYHVSTDANLAASVHESARKSRFWCRLFVVLTIIITVWLAVRMVGSLGDAGRDQATYATAPPPSPPHALLPRAPPLRA
jgi:nitrate reductase NapE component